MARIDSAMVWTYSDDVVAENHQGVNYRGSRRPLQWQSHWRAIVRSLTNALFASPLASLPACSPSRSRCSLGQIFQGLTSPPPVAKPLEGYSKIID